MDYFIWIGENEYEITRSKRNYAGRDFKENVRLISSICIKRNSV